MNVEAQDGSNLSKSQHQQVSDMLGDAMKDIVSDEGMFLFNCYLFCSYAAFVRFFVAIRVFD